MTEKLPGVWDNALKMAAYGRKVIPLNEKDAFLPEWPKKGRSNVAGIKEWAKLFPKKNYGIIIDDFFVLEIDLDGADYVGEVDRLRDILGPFTPGFTVKTGREGGGYHIYCRSDGREIPKQDLTTLTQVRGVGHYVVGPGSMHPNGTVYTIDPLFQGNPTDDPSKLTEISDETLDRLAKKRDVSISSQSTEKVFTFGEGDVLELEHPPCIRRLMLKGAPNDQEYVQSNHTIARYVISSVLSDADGAAIAAEMANHTVGHKTTKNEFDRVYNFRTCLNSARANPDANQFACSYVRGSSELIDNNLCKGCPKEATKTSEVPADLQQRVRAHAYHVLTKGDPYEYFIRAYHQSHARDDAVGKVTLLSVADQSVLNAEGIYPHATGGSGKGKSSGKKSVYHLVPREYVFKRSFSDKALFYLKLPDEAILFLDDQTMSSEMEELARGIMDDFQGTKERTTVVDGKELTLTIPPRCNIGFTNVDSSLNLQTANRTVNVSVDESEKADEEVFKLWQQRGKTGAPKYPETFEVLVCREMFRIIKQEIGPFRVSIPYNDFIAFPRKDDRRNPDIFGDFIHGLAALRCMQRSTREGFVFANKKDFDDAAELYNSLSKTQTSKLGDDEILVLQAIFDSNKSATINDIVKSSGLKYGTVRNILKGKPGRPDTGLLDKISGLTKSKLSDRWQDPNDTGHSTSKNAELFELKDDFDILHVYDMGTGVTLLPGWKDVDINTIKLWTPFTAFTGFYTAFTDVYKSNENVEIKSDDKINSSIETYKQQLQQQTTTFTDIPEREGIVSHKKQNQPPELDFALPLPPLTSKSSKSVKAEKNENNKTQNKEEIENKVHIDENVLLHRLVKAGYKQNPPYQLVLEVLESLHIQKVGAPITSLNTTHPHTDEDFCRFFELELMQFKYTDGRKRHKCTTDDDVGVVICKTICDERSIHLHDVMQAWGRLSDNKAIVSVLDEIFGRAHKGKADGPKLMED
jgi:Bifunctional DNA primase/polymerase, N-terminal